ncbi:hypothetical protein GCM10009118_24270 [Wandonia haliotis]|uniref:Uncharacterized protein n=1 Tax=Wandonia haliotis TaxID=574963 RepID=A0ABP3Y8S9_9FLAO
MNDINVLENSMQYQDNNEGREVIQKEIDKAKSKVVLYNSKIKDIESKINPMIERFQNITDAVLKLESDG